MTPESVSPSPLPPTPGTGEGPDPAPTVTPRPGALDALLAGLVVALAFLLASTPARNSDLWLHLASGRSLAESGFPGGKDPFSSTTAGVFWVNHTWLSDAALYALYQVGDGRALVIAKAVLVAVLAWLFFGFRRPGTRVGFAALAAAGAVLALGPWLLLQPMLVSLLGVVLTLYLLERPALREGAAADRARALRWLLVPLFALWANLDAWFLLGPALVALYAVGALVAAGRPPARPGEARALVLLTLAGSAACLLTPYHVHTFALPTPLGLSHTEQVLMRDPLGQGLVVSPFGGRLAAAPAFASPGGWAYCLLLAAGAVSFLRAGRDLHHGRFLAWLALAALSFYQARAIPFFAAAAGPMLALNLQDVAWRPRHSAVARPLGVLAGLALLVLAWPGWLQPAPYHPRGWTVEPDGSLVRLAGRLQAWYADPGFRPPHSALTFSPEVAHYLAWFCPAEKGFLDSRWPLFDRVADDYVQMRNCLLRPESTGPDPGLVPLLEKHDLDRILLYDPDGRRTTQAFRCLLLGGDEWELIALEGSAALFGRRAGPGSPSPWPAFDWGRAAYRPGPEHQAPRTAPRPPEPPAWFDPFLRARDDRSPDRGEAALDLLAFDVLAERRRADLGRHWLLAQATGLVGAAGPGARAVHLVFTPLPPDPSSAAAASAPAPVGEQVAGQMTAAFLARHDRGGPEPLLLAVRAARRAVAANPEDGNSFRLLGEAYLRLARQTSEQDWQAALPDLASLRRDQALTALEQAVLLRPDLDEAHAHLVQLYYQAGVLDRALDHLRARLRIAEREAKRGGPDAAAAADRRAALQADVQTMETLVGRSQDIYDANTQGKTDPSTVVDRARLAVRHGLARQALDMLLASDRVKFGKAGALMEVELLLGAGRAFEVLAWLEPEQEGELGYGPYHSLRARAAAACGAYAEADAELGRLGEQLRQVQIAPGLFVPVRTAVALRAGDVVLNRPALGTGLVGRAAATFRQFDELQPVGGLVALLRKEADLQVLRGLVALEPGDVDTARRHFRTALDLWGDEDRVRAGAGTDFPGRPVAQQALRLLDEAGR